jgi:hypothetical protein
MARKKSPIETFIALPDAEKDRIASRYDKEFNPDEFHPLTPAQKKLWEKAKNRRPGRPTVGKGVQVISLSVERTLLKKADALAKRRGVSRAKVMAEGLEMLLRAS